MKLEKPMKKKKSRRDKIKYPALDQSVNLKSRIDEVNDVQSYAKNLPDELTEVTLNDGTKKMMNPKEWMNNFMEEYNNANFQHKGERIHKTKKLKRACEHKNNARNRCIYTQEASKNRLKQVERIEEFEKLEISEFSKPVKMKRKK